MTKYIGRNVKMAREKCRYSQEELAKRLNISVRTVRRLENGSSMTGVGTLIKIAGILNTTVDELLCNPEQEMIMKTSGDCHDDEAFLCMFAQLPEDVKVFLTRELRAYLKKNND